MRLGGGEKAEGVNLGFMGYTSQSWVGGGDKSEDYSRCINLLSS